MAVEVFFRDDIAQGIAAVVVAVLETATAHGNTNAEFVRGVEAMALAQALAFGLDLGIMRHTIRQALDGEALLVEGEE